MSHQKQLIYDKIKVFEEGFVCDLLNPNQPFPYSFPLPEYIHSVIGCNNVGTDYSWSGCLMEY